MVVMINCSFRGEKSNSNYFLGLLETQLDVPCERIHLAKMKDMDALWDKLSDADAIVLGMPLYVDGVPAQAMALMEALYEKKEKVTKKLRVYVVTNLGFYESRQAKILLAIVRNWCAKMEMEYGGGLSIGAGEMMGGLRNVPMNQGPNKEMGEGIRRLAAHIKAGTAMEDVYTEPTGFSRGMYRIAADMNWAPQAKKHGVSRKQIRARRERI